MKQDDHIKQAKKIEKLLSTGWKKWRQRLVALAIAGYGLFSGTSANAKIFDTAEAQKPDVENMQKSLEVYPSGIENIATPNAYEMSFDNTKEKIQEKLTEYFKSHTFEEAISQGVVSWDGLRDCPFSEESLRGIELGEWGHRFSKLGERRTSKPKGRCLEKTREDLYKATGYNIYSPTGRACDWDAGIDACEEKSPLICVGTVVWSHNKNGGSIELEALSGTKGYLLVFKAGTQKNGHTTRTTGENAFCDGKENLDRILDTKVGGHGKRYGEKVIVYALKDSKPSEKMAQDIARYMVVRGKFGKCLAAIDREAVIRNDIIKPFVMNQDIDIARISEEDIQRQFAKIRGKLDEIIQENMDKIQIPPTSSASLKSKKKHEKNLRDQQGKAVAVALSKKGQKQSRSA